jgi:hypothetical protein
MDLRAGETLRSSHVPEPELIAYHLVIIPVQAARPSIFLWPVVLWDAAFILLGWSATS